MQTMPQPIGTLLNGSVANLKKIHGATQLATHTTPPNPLLLGEMPLRESVQAQNQLTLLLQQTYACQKTYADKAEMMDYRDGMFQVILADYAIFEIKKAFFEYVKRAPDLPTPSDIVKLIDEDRKYRLLQKPDINKLLEYKRKGIPLTPAQEQDVNRCLAQSQRTA